MAVDFFSAFEGAERLRLEAMFSFELQAREQGFRRVAGVDEAGRGPLAGPLVAAAVVLARPVAGLNDSKKLTAAQRDALFETIVSGGHAVGVCIVPAAELDALGVQQANYSAMVRAAESIVPLPDLLLVDGFAVPGTALPQWRLVKGDQRSLSIAAASIVAKVTRDRIMEELDRKYPQYLFARHKGYGTAEHMTRLERHGPCPEHRRSFAPLSTRTETAPLFESDTEA
jgi:ribonuclease HII